MEKSCNNSACNKESCEGCQHAAADFREKPHDLSQIKRVIGVVSGKGGVGKSLVTSLLAVTMNRLGYRTAILDADITGPSIPKAFGITKRATANEQGLLPVSSKNGVEIMSLNLLLENETDPVVWRGPVIGGTVKQFWTDVIWSDIDYMFIDMPPGTGDVPLTVFQSIAVDGIVVVTSPQELVSMIVEKAVKMAQMMNIPILGLVENLSYFTCPDNGKNYAVFGDSHIDAIAQAHNLPVLARLPIDPAIAAACDKGEIESLPADWFDKAAELLKELPESQK
ncbi:MAG: Mrp/NBP35 family ATP-binding protein [Ruminococcaceae bacterium]|nr:Mrp/NBP35 family ATP-binding protein [Oscillospiraceae bacterium]